jgi:hypothetical protein
LEWFLLFFRTMASSYAEDRRLAKDGGEVRIENGAYTNIIRLLECLYFAYAAAARVSEVLFRIANSADLTGLSLEVDLAGVELAHAGEAREQGEVKKAS